MKVITKALEERILIDGRDGLNMKEVEYFNMIYSTKRVNLLQLHLYNH